MGIYRTQRSGGAVTPRCFWDRKGNHEKAGHWNFSPCGCGEDHLIRGDAVHLRHTEAAGAGGPPGRLSGHGGAGAERGITIFSKQAVLPLSGVEVTLLDTPGHVDFSSEMERTLQVLDCAILVISRTDGCRGTPGPCGGCWSAITSPPSSFVNKMDLAGADRAVLMAELQRLDSGCVDFGQEGPGLQESVAMCDEERWSDIWSGGRWSRRRSGPWWRGAGCFPAGSAPP